MTGVFCGIDGCVLDLVWTHRPASSLYCSVHGHVLDALPSPPLQGIAFLTGPDGCCGVVDLDELARG